MYRSVVRGRIFPVVALAYVAAIGLQIFFAGLYVFVGPANLELHKTFAHVFILLTVLMVAAAFIGQVDGRAKRLTFGLMGLLALQGTLVHLGQWFGLWTIAALHPVNAMVMTYVSVTLARHALAMWRTERAARSNRVAAPSAV